MSNPSKDFSGYTEKDIWSLLKSGNQEALSLLVHRYYDDLFRYGSGFTEKVTMVEDLIQDLFCDLWQKRVTLSDVLQIKPYLFTSVRNRIFRQLAREKKLVSLDKAVLFRFDIDFSPEDLFILQQDKMIVTKVLNDYINQLSPRQKEVIFLRFYENLTYEAIAQIMSISVPYLYLLIHKSLAKLRVLMVENGIARNADIA